MSSYGSSELKAVQSEARSSSYCDEGVGLGILLMTALGVGIMFFTLYTKVTMAMTGRKKRRDLDDHLSSGNLVELLTSGKRRSYFHPIALLSFCLALLAAKILKSY